MTLLLDEDLAAYHADPAVSNGKIRDFDQLGPKGFYLRHVRHEAPRKDAAALMAGRAFETFLFEPRLFDGHFAVKPQGCNFTKPEWKAWKKEQEAARRTIIDRDDFLAFEHMAAAVHDCGSARSLLEGCAAQPTWRTDWPGLPGLQSRPDMANLAGCPISDFRPYTVDLKTTRSLNELVEQKRAADIPVGGRSLIRYGYHTQAATVRMSSGVGDLVHYLIVAEKAFPCRAIVLELPPVFVDIGERWVIEKIAELADHYQSDHWPLTREDLIVVQPPAWLLAQHAANDFDEDDLDEAAP